MPRPLWSASSSRGAGDGALYVSQDIIHVKLNVASLHLVFYAEPSFANKRNGSSQLSYLIVLPNATNKYNILCYKSFKRKRVTRSFLGAEVMVLFEAFGFAFILKYDLEQILQRRTPFTMITKSSSLLDLITNNSTTS